MNSTLALLLVVLVAFSCVAAEMSDEEFNAELEKRMFIPPINWGKLGHIALGAVKGALGK